MRIRWIEIFCLLATVGMAGAQGPPPQTGPAETGSAETGPAGTGHGIVQSRGVDGTVDYASLQDLGPWDDRNYFLRAEDLALLAPNEAELDLALPVFFRVELRKARPEMPRSGPVQYPRAALPAFRNKYGGYLIDGQIYTGTERTQGRLLVDSSAGVPLEEFFRLRALQGEAKVTSPNGAAESAVALHPTNTNLVIAGTNGPGSGQKMHYSSNGGQSWSSAAALPQGGHCCDPTVAWSSDGSKAYAATLANNLSGVWFYRSSNNGQSWNDLSNEPGNDPRREVGSNVDKEYLHVDVAAGSPYLDHLYLTWHENNVMKFSRSTDFGHTWSNPLTLSSGANEQGIGSDITSDAAGSVYYFWPAFNDRTILMRKSVNGGASFQATRTVTSTQGSFAFPVPSMESREVFMYVSADTDRTGGIYDGSIYAAWTDSTASTGSNPSNNHARIRVAYSRNGGTSWTVTTPHETADANTVDRWHQWLAVGADGRVHVIFYDTRRDPARSSVDLFYSVSSDGAQNWGTPTRLTAQQSPNIGDGFEYGDYNGLDVVMNDLLAVYTDNRSEGGGGGDSVDVYVAGDTIGSNDAPEVTIATPDDGDSFASGATMSFQGTATDAQDGSLTGSLAWTSSRDGAIGSGGSFTRVLSDGAHVVTATVSDSGGLQSSDSITIQVGGGNAAPLVSITAPGNGATFAAGSSITFAGTATDVEDGTLTASLSWSSDRDGAIGNGGSFSTVLSVGVHTIRAEAADSGGRAGSAEVQVSVLPISGSAFEEDFEGGLGDWTATGLWHLVTSSPCASPAYASATRAVYFGRDAGCDYDTGATAAGSLTSPVVVVPADATVRFSYLRVVESSVNDPYDATFLQVRAAGVGSWTTLWSRTSLDPSTPMWADSGELSLGAFAGQTVELRFRFDSDDEMFNGFLGWMIDDVVVSGGGADGSIFADGFESGLSAWTLP